MNAAYWDQSIKGTVHFEPRETAASWSGESTGRGPTQSTS
jgi:hypothetical protein